MPLPLSSTRGVRGVGMCPAPTRVILFVMVSFQLLLPVSSSPSNNGTETTPFSPSLADITTFECDLKNSSCPYLNSHCEILFEHCECDIFYDGNACTRYWGEDSLQQSWQWLLFRYGSLAGYAVMLFYCSFWTAATRCKERMVHIFMAPNHLHHKIIK